MSEAAAKLPNHGVSAAWRGAFTLIEIMIVVGIMGIALTMGVPMVYKVWHKEPMRQAISDVVEVCSNARARAILQGRAMDLIIYPRQNRFSVEESSSATNETTAPEGAPAGPRILPVSHQGPETAPTGSGLAAQLSDKVIIELLDINMSGIEYRDADQAKVRFYPNGTCDEMKLVLFDGRDHYGIDLEVTTALADVVKDPLRAWAGK